METAKEKNEASKAGAKASAMELAAKMPDLLKGLENKLFLTNITAKMLMPMLKEEKEMEQFYMLKACFKDIAAKMEQSAKDLKEDIEKDFAFIV